MSRRLQADLLLILVCAVWGATFVVVKEALKDASTLLFLTLRFTLGAAALMVLVRRVPREAWWPGAATGLFLFLGYFLQTQGLRWTSASHSAFITGLAVVLVPVLSALLTRRLPGWNVMVGVLMALTGLALLTGLLTFSGRSASISKGDIWTLGCTVAFAIHILLVGHFSARVVPAALTAGQVLTAAILGAISFPWAESYFLRLTPRLLLAVLITGLFCTAIAYYAQAWAQQFTSATHTALIFSTEPVFAWLTSRVVLGEELTGLAGLGALLILGGIVFAEVAGRRPEPVQV